uniref:Mast cell expressed membrane protein 1 n=1 Tax=Ursus americanus TaxID=9643 RepID=A0A452RXK0_URSAM
MQAAAFKNKKQRGPADKEVPTLSRPPSDSAQVPRCLQRALVTLHILLALSCIILLALVLAKNSEMSQELLVLKRELWNVSISVRECQEEQNRGWSSTQQLITEAKQDIDAVKRHVQSGNNIVKTLQAGALADLRWVEFVSCWVLGSWGRGSRGPTFPVRGQGVRGWWMSPSESLRGYLNAAGNTKYTGTTGPQAGGWEGRRLPIKVGALCETPHLLSPVLLPPDVNQIKNKLQEISKALETKPQSCKLGLERWKRREPQVWPQFLSWGRDLPDRGSPFHPETSTNEKTSKTWLHLPMKLATCVCRGVL